MNITFSSPITYKDKTYVKGRIFTSQVKAKTPKYYTEIGVVGVPELTSTFNSGTMTLYTVPNKSFRFSIFRDGNFHPYYGTIILLEASNGTD